MAAFSAARSCVTLDHADVVGEADHRRAVALAEGVDERRGRGAGMSILPPSAMLPDVHDQRGRDRLWLSTTESTRSSQRTG